MNLIYALGGGRGHATRAFELCRRMGSGVVFHQAPGPWPAGSNYVGRIGVPAMRDRLLEALGGARRFIIDSFPGGIAHELVDLPIPPGVRTVLVARYVDRAAYADYDKLAARFDEVWLPYDPERCEWERPPPGTYIGPVVRPLRLEGSVDTLVIGSGEPASWSELLSGSTRVDRLFHSLPRARRVVALAAGYNLGWELAMAGMDVGFLPQTRRFDDQFRRAAQLGTPLLHRTDLEGFLAC